MMQLDLTDNERAILITALRRLVDFDPQALLLPQVHGLAHQVDGVTGFGDRGFADSAVEGDGFELSVPGRETVKPSWETGLLSRKRERICWGTESSNPSPSSGESANHRF